MQSVFNFQCFGMLWLLTSPQLYNPRCLYSPVQESIASCKVRTLNLHALMPPADAMRPLLLSCPALCPSYVSSTWVPTNIAYWYTSSASAESWFACSRRKNVCCFSDLSEKTAAWHLRYHWVKLTQRKPRSHSRIRTCSEGHLFFLHHSTFLTHTDFHSISPMSNALGVKTYHQDWQPVPGPGQPVGHYLVDVTQASRFPQVLGLHRKASLPLHPEALSFLNATTYTHDLQ